MLDLSGNPSPRVSNYGSSHPKGCYTNEARNTLSLNTVTSSSSAAECSLQFPCICADCPTTTKTSTGKWEMIEFMKFHQPAQGGKKSSHILLCCALPDYILTIGGGNNRVNALSTDPICNPIKPCMANLGNFPHIITGAVGTTFGM